MMDERELNRAIETAARALVTREPDRALGGRVMARIEGAPAPARPGFAWMAAAASLAACAAIAIALSPPPAVMSSLPQAPEVFLGQPAAVPPPATEPAALAVLLPRIARRDVAARVASAAPSLTSDASPIEPLETAPIALSPLDVPDLAPETTSIGTLEIAPLTMEPLAASND